MALELAAARLRSLSSEDIARRLDQRFRLLTGGARDRLPRQQMLRAAIDWSYDLLPEVERRVLARMAVFAGAVPLAAVESVGFNQDVFDGEVVDAVDALVAKSLVVTAEHDGETRYRLLDTIRAYAAEKLAAGSDEPAARGRQLAWCIALAEEAGIDRGRPDCDRWVKRFEPLRDDLAGAVSWGLEAPHLAVVAIAVVSSLWWLLLGDPRVLPLMQRTLVRADEKGLTYSHPTLVWL